MLGGGDLDVTAQTGATEETRRTAPFRRPLRFESGDATTPDMTERG